jgi:glycine/D-amino acid oxidase-like deaminating enzyme
MTPPWPTTPPTPADRAAYADAIVRPFWLDDLPQRDAHRSLEGSVEVDLCIVGGGFTGLWAALCAHASDLGRSIAVLEAGTCGIGASGRNGGFLHASLTHGLANGLSRFGGELPKLDQLGLRNFNDLHADLERYTIDAQYEASGDLTVALEPHELRWFEQEAKLHERFGHDHELLDLAQMRAEVDSPTYVGGLWVRTGTALVHPGKLVDGLRSAVLANGTRIFENTRVTQLTGQRDGVLVQTVGGSLTARRVLLGTSAYPPLLRRVRRYLAPVYDYALMTEPLTDDQLEAIGWRRRQGLSEAANQFHYYRLTSDNRILWGGYDAVYRYGGPVKPRLEDHEPTFAKLSQHFFTTFPQLRGIRFSHRWGGAIDTCSRFCVFFGTAFDGRVVYATGYTGLGVGASRFGARVALDLLDGRETELTDLEFVRQRPVPFPPEPLKSGVIQFTRNRLAAADQREGRRGLWLRTLDRLGLGFDS